MRDIATILTNYGAGPFPNYTGKNATGAGATDGTEWIKALIDDFLFGPMQAILDHEGETPNGVAESAGASQIVEAIQKMFPPGMVAEWNLNADPATTGHRYLLLNGQGILRANYPELDANVYVGDANNATADAYYRSDDAAGTIRNITGVYLILPESRGYVPRGLDLAASVDPDGASRTVGHLQGDAFQGHWHELYSNQSFGTVGLYNPIGGLNTGTIAIAGNSPIKTAITDGVNGTPRTATESRGTNRATQFAIRY